MEGEDQRRVRRLEGEATGAGLGGRGGGCG